MVFITSIDPPQDVRHRQENVKAYVNGQLLDSGCLLIAESCLSWLMPSGMGFSIEYPSVTMHAISRDLTSFSEQCLCIMLDSESLQPEGDGDREATSTQLRFAPDDSNALTVMFETMSACQRLHPDVDNSDNEGTEDENESDLDLMPEDDQIIFHRSEPCVVYGNSGDSAGQVHHLETGVGQLMSNGDSLNGHNVDLMVENGDQFEDAEDE